MGNIEHRVEPISLSLLTRCAHIALVRPDNPPIRLEQRMMASTPGIGPASPVAYTVGFARLVVERWVRGEGPDRIELPLPTNTAVTRDAVDTANGMLGQVDHVVVERRLRGEGEDLVRSDGERVVFLACASLQPDVDSFTEPFPGVGLSTEALPAITARIPRAPPRSFLAEAVRVVGFTLLIVMVVAGLVLVISQL